MIVAERRPGNDAGVIGAASLALQFAAKA